MNHAELIVGSKELLETLSRTAASLIKSDGTTCIHLMHDIGHTEDDEYENNLEIAKSDAKLVQMPTTFNEPYFKERWNIAQLSVKVVAELKQAEKQLFDMLAAKIGQSNVLLSASSDWAKENDQHTFIELLAYYRNNVLAVNPTNIKAIRSAASTYDRSSTFEENAANLVLHISALQPYDMTTQFQKIELLKMLIDGMPMQQRAFGHYCQANPRFHKQTLEGAIKYISRELKNNSTDHIEQVSSTNSILHEEVMELNAMLIQNQALQEARINQLQAAMNVNTAATASTPRGPKPPTTKYCHLHGSNNTHDGTECKKMGSTGFTMKGKAVTQAMINNRVPGAVVDGVAGKM